MKTSGHITIEVPYLPLDADMRYQAVFRVDSLEDNGLAVRFPVHEYIVTDAALETATEGDSVHVFLEGDDTKCWQVIARRGDVIYLTQENWQRVLLGLVG